VADSSAAESMKAELRYEFGAVERHHRIKLTFPSGWLTPDLDAKYERKHIRKALRSFSESFNAKKGAAEPLDFAKLELADGPGEVGLCVVALSTLADGAVLYVRPLPWRPKESKEAAAAKRGEKVRPTKGGAMSECGFGPKLTHVSQMQGQSKYWLGHGNETSRDRWDDI